MENVNQSDTLFAKYFKCSGKKDWKEWAEIGKPDLVQKAIARKNRILAESTAPQLDPAVDAAIRAAFNIHV